MARSEQRRRLAERAGHAAGPPTGVSPRIVTLLAIVVMQVFAACYFLIDAITDLSGRALIDSAFEPALDALVTFALIAGIVSGVRHVRTLSAHLRRQDRSLEIARGALAAQIERRFAEWGLTHSEAEIALFAMKGCTIADIARMRDAAQGTVRSQLSQIYAKAGVNSQSMLVSLFIEDLLGAPLAGGPVTDAKTV